MEMVVSHLPKTPRSLHPRWEHGKERQQGRLVYPRGLPRANCDLQLVRFGMYLSIPRVVVGHQLDLTGWNILRLMAPHSIFIDVIYY